MGVQRSGPAPSCKMMGAPVRGLLEHNEPYRRPLRTYCPFASAPFAPVTTSSLHTAHLGPIRGPRVLAACTTTPTQPLHHLPPSPLQSPLPGPSSHRVCQQFHHHSLPDLGTGYALRASGAFDDTSPHWMPPRFGLPTKARVGWSEPERARHAFSRNEPVPPSVRSSPTF